jgi:nicotinate-nucleotide adenylyltransferase
MTGVGKNIGLFFGSFNPVHIGHLIIASHMVEFAGLDQVWLVVSPHNPLKPRQTLARDQDRLHLVRLAIEDDSRLRASNIEFGLPKPSYTVDTLAYMRERWPGHRFHLIMGGDNLSSLDKWKNYEILLRDYAILVYRRPGQGASSWDDHPSVRFAEAPLLDISATFIRQGLREGKCMRYLLPDPVFRYLEDNRMYREMGS